MKNILLLAGAIGVLACATGRAQSWTATGAAHNTERMSDIAVHNGALYVSFTDSQRLIKSSNGGQSWSQVPLDGVEGRIEQVVSAGERLYVRTVVFNSIYYTTDDGGHWTVDTVGTPDFNFDTGKAPIVHMHYWDGHLIAMFDDFGYRHYIKTPGAERWIELPYDTYTAEYASKDDTLFVVVGNTLSYTADHGATWIEPANNGLPAKLNAYRLHLTGNRLYMTGVAGEPEDYKDSLYYSDDRGENWTNAGGLSAAIVTDKFGFYQRTRAMYGIGDRLWVALSNDMSNTAVDVLHSDNGGMTFTHNSEGLPTADQHGNRFVQKFVYHNGILYAMEIGEVYKQTVATGTTVQEPAAGGTIRLYPHPVVDRLDIHSGDGVFDRITVYDLCGRPVLRREYSGTLDVSTLPSGTWLLEITGSSGAVRRTFVRQ